MFRVLLLLLFPMSMALVTAKKKDSICLSERPCYCQLNKTSYIDLSPHAGKIFSFFHNTQHFQINLCKPFSPKKDCNNVMGCLTVPVLTSYSIGNSSTFLNAATLTLQNGSNNRISLITLDCTDKNETLLDFLNENPINVYNFKFKSPDACPKTVATTTPTTTKTTPTSTTTKTTPTSTTTKTTPTSTTTKTTPTSTTTKTTPTTTKTTPTSTTTKTTPTSTTIKTTSTTHPSNSTTTVTTKSSPTVSTTKNTPTTSKIPNTTHGGGVTTTASLTFLGAILIVSHILRCLL